MGIRRRGESVFWRTCEGKRPEKSKSVWRLVELLSNGREDSVLNSAFLPWGWITGAENKNKNGVLVLAPPEGQPWHVGGELDQSLGHILCEGRVQERESLSPRNRQDFLLSLPLLLSHP